jgi:hypothetical protein
MSGRSGRSAIRRPSAPFCRISARLPAGQNRKRQRLDSPPPPLRMRARPAAKLKDDRMPRRACLREHARADEKLIQQRCCQMLSKGGLGITHRQATTPALHALHERRKAFASIAFAPSYALFPLCINSAVAGASPRAVAHPSLAALAEEVDYPLIVEGLASTFDLDMARCQVAPYALSWPSDPLPLLLYRHDPKQVAGRIEDLSFDDRGRLRIKARVEHHEARRAPALVSRSWSTRSATRTARSDFTAWFGRLLSPSAA